MIAVSLALISCEKDDDDTNENVPSRECEGELWLGTYQSLCDSDTFTVFVIDDNPDEYWIYRELKRVNGGLTSYGNPLIFNQNAGNATDSCAATYFEFLDFGPVEHEASLTSSMDLRLVRTGSSASTGLLSNCGDEIIVQRIE
jgi:hypothetical protein